MRLKDWAANKYRLDGVGEEGLHVIGTCGECEHSVRFSETNDLVCQNKKAERCSSPSTDGCIHFEPKEGS